MKKIKDKAQNDSIKKVEKKNAFFLKKLLFNHKNFTKSNLFY